MFMIFIDLGNNGTQLELIATCTLMCPQELSDQLIPLALGATARATVNNARYTAYFMMLLGKERQNYQITFFEISYLMPWCTFCNGWNWDNVRRIVCVWYLSNPGNKEFLQICKNLNKYFEEMHKICMLTKNEATTSLYLMRRFVYLRYGSVSS